MREIDTCIVGATGLVGQTMLKVLEEYDFPVGRLKLLAFSWQSLCIQGEETHCTGIDRNFI